MASLLVHQKDHHTNITPNDCFDESSNNLNHIPFIQKPKKKPSTSTSSNKTKKNKSDDNGLNKKDMWLLITPPTVIQREDYSDIEKRNTNYSQLMLDIDKAYMFNVAPPSSKNNMQRMFYK